ncbi:MAG: cobaltochelatase subunit CobN [Methanophagales archaeon ANME-1-THS]|nr:MAG: cobaltochelatase subunit CobN [Methanophagales archaeon ANME-1-THS]
MPLITYAQSEGNETAMDGNLTFSANVSDNATVKATGEESEKNKITFVLGTDENLASLLNASMNTTVNSTIEVKIYDAAEAKAANFSNETVVFLASLDNETVACINQTINESAYVFAYNLTSNITIGNVEDVNITKYWVYGGDENIRNLVIYMDNIFYGNTTAVDPPKPPENRAKIAFVVHEKVSYEVWLKKASEDVYVSRCLNVSLCTYTLDDPESYKNLNLSDQDVIFLWMLGYPVQDAIKDTVNKAKHNGAYVITHQYEDVHKLGNVNLSDPAYSNITKYWDYGGEENIKRLIIFLGVKFCNVSMEIFPPIPVPLHGLYHPDAPGFGVFETTSEYLEWYNTTGKYNTSNLTVGIHYYNTPRASNYYTIVDPLIRTFELKGANVIFATFTYKDPNSTRYFIQDNKSIVDVIITLTSFRLYYGKEEKGLEYLKNLNVTPLKGIGSFYSSPEEWKNSTGLTPSEIAWQVALPELDGLTEFIFVSGKTKDPVSGLERYDPVDYQVDWITDRAISWAKLHRMNNSEKRVAIIYYNHGGGKDNLGASYLDIVSSLTNLLDAMKDEGYELEGEVPDEEKLLDLMLHQGRNIGTWAPDELQNMVENESLILLPAEEYGSWFNELPANKREEVIEKWGAPPGKIMVYENETGKYIVIPKLSFGNILLAPQPTRGWLQDQAVLYHDKELAPHHQYIAFYFWLKKEYGADAIVHFGTHGTQEWLPGKETALSVRECWPAILIQDLPVVYPYIMDNVGEGTQAKRRGNAVIVDHLTPPIVASGLYGDFSLLHEKIHQYLGAEEALKLEYRETITELYGNLSLGEDLGVAVEGLRAMNDTEFESFIIGELHEYLHELAAEFIPYGLHILGSPPVDWRLISMVESMLGDDFADHIAEVYPDPHELNPAHGNYTILERLLMEVIFNGSSPEDAQENILGSGNVSSNVTEDLKRAKVYAKNLKNCTIEIPRILDGLSGRYVPPKVGNDPIRNPEAIPTGNNFYSFDSRLIPTKEAWRVGMVVADDLLEQYKGEHGDYPRKAAFVLWAVETMRHQGIMESQILYLLGTRPVWDSKGRVGDVELIPSSELGRPRIDVLVTTSGLYRDTFPDKVRLIDKAVRLAYNDSESPNYVRENSDAIYAWLIEQGYSEEEARSLSMARIFSEAPGTYGTGLPNAIAASDTWMNGTKLANLYISRMGYVYGEDGWGVPNVDLFRQNLAKVEVAVHSDNSNLYGVLDNDDFFQYLGGLALAVRSITGETPDLYVTNLRDPHNPKTETLESYLRRELRARYFNPKWLEGMMEHDYAGAREMMKFIENLWGWDVVTPDLITQDIWNQVYDIYVQDKYNLGLKEFFDSNNPYALQSITARMLEAIRKGYWDPSDAVKRALAETYQKSVEKYGVTCCHHTCANLLLQDYMQGILAVPEEQPSKEAYLRYVGGGARRITEEDTTGEGVTNMTEVTGVSKEGEELKKPPEETSEKKGKVMKEETPVEKPSPAFPISGAPLMGIIAVFVILVWIGIGLGLKRRGW